MAAMWLCFVGVAVATADANHAAAVEAAVSKLAQAAQLRAHSDVPIGDQVTAVKEVIEETDEELRAASEEVTDVTKSVASVTDDTQHDQVMGTRDAITWDSAAEHLNTIKNEDALTNFPLMNSQGASLNTLKGNVEEKEDNSNTLENEVNALQTDMTNRREVLDNQLLGIDAACKNMEMWTKHATPIINIQEEALFQISGWVNHLESQMIQVANMLQRMELKLTGESENILEESEHAEDGLVGLPEEGAVAPP